MRHPRKSPFESAFYAPGKLCDARLQFRKRLVYGISVEGALNPVCILATDVHYVSFENTDFVTRTFGFSFPFSPAPRRYIRTTSYLLPPSSGKLVESIPRRCILECLP